MQRFGLGVQIFHVLQFEEFNEVRQMVELKTQFGVERIGRDVEIQRFPQMRAEAFADELLRDFLKIVFHDGGFLGFLPKLKVTPSRLYNAFQILQDIKNAKPDKCHKMRKTNALILHHNSKTTVMSTYEKFYEQFEYGLMGGIALGILASSCLGGIAAMAVLQNGTSLLQMFQLVLVVGFAMVFNGAVLSQQKPRTIYNALLLSVGMNTLLAIINFAMH